MSTFRIELKNHVNIMLKPKVCFTCHPDDFENSFDKIYKAITNAYDCAVHYTIDMNESISEEDTDTFLRRSNLFVIPVTKKLLTTANRAMDEDLAFALKEHIPVLPIVMESRLNDLYSQPDKFGELQYLCYYETDNSQIPFENKLKNYLRMFF